MSTAAETTVVPAYEGARLADARRLFEEYAASLPFDLAFQGFARELAALPGEYAPPRGCLLVALHHGRSVGCVALRPLDAQTAELKRLWVQSSARGCGAGRLLVEAALQAARDAGYSRVRLDTTPGMDAAQRLYRSLGFVQIEPYRENPIGGATFLELGLG